MAERSESAVTVAGVRQYLHGGCHDITDEQIARVIERLPGRAAIYLAHAIEAAVERNPALARHFGGDARA